LARQPEEDADRDEAANAPFRQRRCIVSGAVLPDALLIRFVAGPDGQVVPDLAARLPGRGLWVRSTREAVATAVAKKLFARAARAPVLAHADLVARVETLLVERLAGQLGLAYRAGLVLIGFDMIERAMRGKTPPPFVIEAREAGADGRRKLQAAAVSRGIVPFTCAPLSGAELSLAFGRENVVHAALKSGPDGGRIAERLIGDLQRLGGFRPLDPWVWNGFRGA
jgi:predicted RNA-binding protein YlxR (DUF448 family)